MTILLSFFILLGSFFAFVAALGVVRLPDFYCRMHAATKAGAFGGSLLVLAAMLQFGSLWVVFEGVLIIVFFYFTAPVAAHLLGRSAYRLKTPAWEGTKMDELKACYVNEADGSPEQGAGSTDLSSDKAE